MQKWLLSRLFDAAEEQPVPHFAFAGTVNWMRALAITIESGQFETGSLSEFYGAVGSRSASASADTQVFENIFLAFNHLAGLNSISEAENGYDVCRPAISSWYHVIYAAASSMVAAATGEVSQSYEGVSSSWHAELVEKGMVRKPFSPALTTLVKSVCDAEVSAHRGANTFDLNRPAQNQTQAWGGIVSYLKGTADFERARLEDLIRETPQFRALGVANFRTKAAQVVRDQHLQHVRVNFLVQAWRYVGKASYRDSIFLSYGDDRRNQIDQFLVDLSTVATAFLRMACAYCSRRVENGAWDDFVEDIEANSRLSLGAHVLRV